MQTFSRILPDVEALTDSLGDGAPPTTTTRVQ